MTRTSFLIGLTIFSALLIDAAAGAGQQPPTATPVVITATPLPQIVVVTATPSAPSAPETFWSAYGPEIVIGLIGLVIGGMLTWLLRPLFESLGKMLVDTLGKLGSGWGFRRRYLNYLIEEYRALNIRGLRNLAKVTVELEHVYVSLSAGRPEDRLGGAPQPPQGIGEAMAQDHRLAILGGPGTGKSTLLAYLTLTYARGQAKRRLGLEERLLPVHVPLRRLKAVLSGGGGLPAYLEALYREMELRPRPGMFQAMLRAGRCLVLLDGLDEVADEGERRQMAEWIDRLVTVYPHNRYLVTSRPPGYERAPLKNGFAVRLIRDFSAADVRQFAQNWCLAVELAARGEDNAEVRRKARETSSDLVAAIEANSAIRALAANPLLLSIVALVHRYRAVLPRRRVDLYDECVQVLLGQWDEAKGLASTLSPREKRAILQPLAFEMHCERRREIPHRELVERTGALLPRVGGEAAAAGEFVDQVKERSGLLVEVSMGQYGWSHLSFQEYLCARELADEPAKGSLLMGSLDDEWWREVALLYAGMADATPVVEALLARQEDPDCRALLLAGQCVAEAARIEPAARERVVTRLQAQFAACSGQQFLQVGQVLAEIGGEDGVGFFLRIAQQDPARRDAALGALGQMAEQPDDAQRERVMERLLTCFRDRDLHGVALAVLAESLPPERLAEMLDAALVPVPAGPFLMGQEKRRVQVNAFAIGRYPVTNVQYKRFVDAAGHAPPQRWRNGTFPAGQALHPVVYVTWNDADAYARWAGQRLPTEVEWEKAARGTDGRVYPWGDEWDADKCNTQEAGIGGTTPVGRYSPAGDSPYGCADMAGNVWAWTTSEYEGIRGSHVLRGSSWYNSAGDVAVCAARHYGSPDYSFASFGFRVVSPISPSGS